MRQELRVTNWAPGNSYTAEAGATRRAERRRQAAQSRFRLHEQAVYDLEFKLHVDRRWEPDDAKYKEIEDYTKKRQFHQALNKLQGLVLQRLFELQKANIPGMSKSITSSLSESPNSVTLRL